MPKSAIDNVRKIAPFNDLGRRPPLQGKSRPDCRHHSRTDSDERGPLHSGARLPGRAPRPCTPEGALLIFDEVKTGAKLGRGGASEYFNVKADIMTLAKSIGGGFPFAAFAASRPLMDVISQQKVFHAGTYNTNPVSMAAGLATFREVLTPDSYAHVAKVGRTWLTVTADRRESRS